MKQLSGKFVVRMPGNLHARLKQEALNTGQSLNQLCLARLQANLGPAVGLDASRTSAHLIPPHLLEAIVRQWPKELIGLILFGSAARGEASEASDTDLMLTMKPGVKIMRELYRVWEDFCHPHFEVQESVRISPHFVCLPGSVQEAGGLWYETAIDGIILWERDSRVSRFLVSVRRAMGQGKIRRRIVHGSPYWIKDF
jgi:hypothetical protein